MGQLTNNYINTTYQGLLKLANSTTGITDNLQYTQDGLGENLPIQISRTQVNITGSLTVNGQPITGGTGTSGTSGANGTSGSSGTNGVSGSAGSSGSSGSSGTNGVTGSSGSAGTSGSSGTNGVSGSSGSSGSSGTNGVTGSNGTSGSSGTDGIAGSSGSSGSSGTDGANGTNGTNGSAGTSGSSGTMGTAGSGGTNGTAGTSGSSGTNGVSNSFFNYQAKTNSTSGNPGSGHVIWNSATQTGSTEINVADIDQNGDNIDIFLGNLSAGSVITIQDQANQGNYQKWTLGTPVDNTTYYTYPVTLVAATHSFSNNDPILFIIISTPSGTSGSSGTSGQNGTSGSSGTNGTDGTSGSSGSSGSSGASPFAQTGSFYNTTNNIGITGSLNVRGGDVDIISNNTTVNNELYLTSSTAGQANIILGWGDNPATTGAATTQANFTGSLRMTGSNNIVAMPQISATFNAGRTDQTGYISGSSNIILNNLGGIYLNTGSLLFPKTQGNIINGANSLRMDFTTSSITGGHPTINQNIINGNSFIISSNSGSINANNNILNAATVTLTQNFVTNARATFNNNILNGTTTLNHISSSINYTNNLGNGQITVNNHLSSSGIASNNLGVSANLFVGGGSGLPLNIYVSGSQNSNSTRGVNNNLIGGASIIVSSSFVSSSNSNLFSSIIFGNGLAISGSHIGTGGGSAFFGRFNATGSLQESTEDTVFVVGTGNGNSSRRNALRIDSNNNSNFTGSVNISGSLTASGSFDQSGSVNLRGITSQTGYTNTLVYDTSTGAVGYSTGSGGGSGTSGTSGVSPSLVGLITTGSVGGSQTITGSLNIVNGGFGGHGVTITSGSLNLPATNTTITNGNLNIVSGNLSLQAGNISTNGDIIFNGSSQFSGNTPTYVSLAQRTPEIWSFGNIVSSAPQSGSNLYITNNNSNQAGFTFDASWANTSANLNISNLNGSRNVSINSDTTIISSSVSVTGSVKGNVNALSISSQTASLDLNTGNFFTLQLVSGSATHINPSNIAAGQTINIKLATTGSGTVTFPSSVDQASGSSYVPTTTTGTDIITLVSFDSSTLYLASVKNLV